MANATGPGIRPIPPAQIQQWQRVSSGQTPGARQEASREIREALLERGIEVFADARYGVGSLGDVIGEERSWDGNITTYRTLDLATMEWSDEVQLVTGKGTGYLPRNHSRIQELGFETDRGEPEPVPPVVAATLCD